MTVEKIDNNIIDIFENDIEYYIQEFKEIHNIDNYNNVTQSVFKAMLSYVYKNVFKGTNKLKSSNKYKTTSYGTMSNYNSYDIDIVSELLDYYISLCRLYDKVVSIVGFCCLTGIDQDTIYDWRRMQGKNATRKSFEIWKKLDSNREDGLTDLLMDCTRSPVGILGILNHEKGWAGTGNMVEDKAKQNITLADVQRKAALLSDNSRKDQDAQAEKPVIELSDNLTQLKTP